MQSPPRWTRRAAQRFLIGAIWIGSGVFLFAWSGIYNVAASSGHWGVVETFLRFSMRHSVSLRAGGVEQPDLGSRELIALGAGHFEQGCAFCHGSPDRPGSPVTSAMLPPPPSLSRPLNPWTDQELFWIIRHGIKYTGMPAWPAIERADEIWAMVAFLRKMPDIDAAEYRAIVLPRVERGDAQRAPADPAPDSVVRICAGCHGDRDSGPVSALVPRLHGQRETFLANALRQYSSGARRSGIMQQVAAKLDSSEIDLVAKYYAGLAPLPTPSSPADTAPSAHGRKLATEGDPARRIPACVTCHRREAHDAFPMLDGQSAAYLAVQMRLWKSGHNTATDGAAIMAPIAQRLEERDIEALARHFADRPAQVAAEERP